MNKPIKEYAMDILLENGCDEYSYGGTEEWCKAEKIEEELKQAYPNGMKYPYDQVAKAIREISKLKAKDVRQEGFDFDDWGKYGVTDFYDEPKAELQKALDSGKPFNTGWHGSRKEFDSMCIVRGDDETIVMVNQCMDDAEDLIYDCLLDDEEKKLSDDIHEEIMEFLYSDCCFSTEAEAEESIRLDASMDEIIQTAEKLRSSCHQQLNDSFRICIGTTLQALYPDKAENWEEMYLEHCKRLWVGE